MRRLVVVTIPALVVGFLLSAFACCPAAAIAASARTSGAPSWSLPIPTTTTSPFADQNTLSAITCADATDCLVANVGSADNGEIYRSSDLGSSWLVARPADDDGGGPLACAPDSNADAPFCIAISGGDAEYLSASDGVTTTNTGTQQASDLANSAALACPTSQLCVAVGASGGDGVVNASRSPLSGTWNANDVDPGHPLDAISCPDAGLCAALDSAGNVLVSTSPLNGAWTATQVSSGLDQISCPSDQLCVAVSSQGRAYVSTDPAAGEWSQAAVPGAGDLTGVSCPNPSFCAISEAGGAVYASSNPGAGAFTEVVALSSGLGGIDCVSPDSCLVIDGANVIASASALTDYDEWRSTDVDGWTPLAALSCPSASLCVALQSDGRAATSTDPLTATAGWTVSPGDSGQAPVDLDCPASTRCYAIDSAGGLATSSAPSTGTWRRVKLDRRGRPVAISCPTRSFCAMVDSAGYLFSSTDPSGGTRAWNAVRLERPFTLRGQSVTLTDVTCPSTRFCLVTDGNGNIFTSSNPRGAAGAWTRTPVWPSRYLGDNSLASADCPTATTCVVMATDTGWLKKSQYDPDALGTYALTSHDPTGGQTRWAIRQIDGGYVEPGSDTNDPGVATGLSCPTTSLCAMVDDLGTALTSTGAPSGRWLSAPIDAQASPGEADGSPGLTAVSCIRGGHCVAVDGFGNRFIFGAGVGPVRPAYAIRYSS